MAKNQSLGSADDWAKGLAVVGAFAAFFLPKKTSAFVALLALLAGPRACSSATRASKRRQNS